MIQSTAQSQKVNTTGRRFSRLYHALRHTTLGQLSGVLNRWFSEHIAEPEDFLPHAPGPFPGHRLSGPVQFAPPPRLHPSPCKDSGLGFKFLGRPHQAGDPPGWLHLETEESKEWLHALHSFDWIWDLPLARAREIVLDWTLRYRPSARQASCVDGNKPGDTPGTLFRISSVRGRVPRGWDPQPTSARLVNWCTYFCGKHRSSLDNDPVLRFLLWFSICRQCAWLSQNIETDDAGGKLLENGAALTLAGSCFKGEQADEWLDQGSRIVADQIREQILPDGFHFQRSPTWHFRIMYLLDTLVRAAPSEIAGICKQYYPRMRQAVLCMLHPDGKMALFNEAMHFCGGDSTGWLFGNHLAGRSSRKPAAAGTWELPDAGYFGWRDQAGNCLICDAGPLGPEHNMSRSHADTLSFELSLRGRRVIVDTGNHTFENTERRALDRSTHAHNTAIVDGEGSSDVYSGRRIGRRARPELIELVTPSAEGSSEFRLAARHDGFTHLAGVENHRRTWKISGGVLEIEDEMEGSGRHEVEAFYHFHPELELRTAEENRVEIVESTGRKMGLINYAGEGISLSIENSEYHPCLGFSIPNRRIRLKIVGNLPLRWQCTIPLAGNES